MSNKKREKRFTSQKVLYMVFALLTSIVLWLYISITDAPDITVPVSGIRVVLIGTEELADNNLVVTELSNKTVTLRFNGKRSQIYNLNSENVHVELDLTDIAIGGRYSQGRYSLRPTVVYDKSLDVSSVSVSSSSADYVQVLVETLVSRTVPVRIVNNGGVAAGYLAEEAVVDPTSVVVSGPAQQVKEVSYALASFTHEPLSASVTQSVGIVLMDADDELIESDSLTLDQDSVTVSVKINKVVTVPLQVKFTYGAGITEANASRLVEYTINPTQIELSGDPKVLDELTALSYTIDLTKFATSTTETFHINIPTGCENLTGITEATVTVNVKGLDTTKLSTRNISITDLDVGDEYEIVAVTEAMVITLRGPADQIARVSPDDVRVVVSAENIDATLGTYTLTAKVYVDGFGDVGAVGRYNVTFKIQLKTADTQEETS